MIAAGWMEEVERLLSGSGEEKLGQCPAIGYKELMEVCLRRATLVQAQESIEVQTWHYAKRQITWLKRASGIIPLTMAPSIGETCDRLRAIGNE